MNFDYDYPYVEDELDDMPNKIYEVYGVNKIKELSRQLQTFLNYKTATIQYWFTPKNNLRPNRMIKQLKEAKNTLEDQVSKFLRLLSKFKGESYEPKLKMLVKNLNLTNDRQAIRLKTDLNSITQELFTSIHILSEQDLHLYPELLKFISKLTQELCNVSSIINNWAEGFYEELRLNYSQLYEELSLIVPEKIIENNIKKPKSLGSGLKEW